MYSLCARCLHCTGTSIHLSCSVNWAHADTIPLTWTGRETFSVTIYKGRTTMDEIYSILIPIAIQFITTVVARTKREKRPTHRELFDWFSPLFWDPLEVGIFHFIYLFVSGHIESAPESTMLISTSGCTWKAKQKTLKTIRWMFTSSLDDL